MIEKIRREKKQLGIEETTDVVADCGYYTEQAIMNTKENKDCRPVVSLAAEGTQTTKSKSGKGKKVPTAAYENDKFVYDEVHDVYTCPKNQELKLKPLNPAS